MPTDHDELVALGAFAGAQVLIVLFSVIIANAYRERALLLHGAATIASVLAVQLLVGGSPIGAEAAMLAALALDGLQLRDVISHVGAMRRPRLWLTIVSVGVLPALAVTAAAGEWLLLLPGLGAWSVVTILVMLRAWPQSRPWASLLVLGQLALAVAAGWLGWRSLDHQPDPALPLAALLTLWAAAIFLAISWRNRIFGETWLRMEARATVDPLTGLSTPLIFYDRVSAVRNLITRYGHPSVLLLVHIENLPALLTEFGPEVAESAVLVSADRIRQSLRDGDVAARLSHSRFGVLAEGMSLAEAASSIASRILVAGLKQPLPAAPAEFLQFRVVLAAVPVSDVPSKQLLQRMAIRMDEQLRGASERRIVTLSAEDLMA